MRNFYYLFVLMIFLGGCSKVAVETDYNPAADLTSLKTYSWLKTDKGISDLRVRDPRVEGWVRASVDEIMAEKGYTAVHDKSRSPDFIMSWFGVIESKVKEESIDHFYSSYGYGPVAAKMAERSNKGVRVREYEEGTILLDMLDPKTGSILWQGKSTDRLRKGMDDQEASLYVERLIKQMLKKFPGK